jgi:hypothetical protein
LPKNALPVRPFMDLPGLTLLLKGERQEFPGERDPLLTTAVAVQLPAWKVEIDGVLRILNEFSAWAAGDRHPPPSVAWPPRDHHEYERYSARETGRIGAFIVFACNVSDMIEHQARQVHGLLDLVEPAGSTARTKSREVARARLRTCRKLRHKVFAHTAAASRPPKGPPDPLSIRATSVFYVSGNGNGWRNDEYQIGSLQVAETNGPAKQATLPAVTLASVQAEAAAALTGWWEMLARDIEQLQGFSDDELRKVVQELDQAIRVPRYEPPKREPLPTDVS